ncbi:MAG: AsmA family protein [Gammaproteobacteria bacterium]|nr:AsmA family protein [Gammaproteobacteria bacterium]
MRTAKILTFVLGGLVVVVAALLAAVWLFVNPNDFKGRIEAMVHDSTGRDLALPGDIKLSVFPWIALELGPASLGNRPGFGSEPFASVQHVALRVELLPLLRKKLHIGRVEIDGLDLRLRKNAAGVGNWTGFGGAHAQPASGSDAGGGGVGIPDLAGIVLKNGRISYQSIVADHINLDVGHLGTGLAVPVKLALELSTKTGSAPFGFAADFNFTPDAAARRFRFATLQLQGKLHPKAGSTVAWDFTAPDTTIDVTTQAITVPHFIAHFADARVSGRVAVEKFIDAPRADGSVHLDQVSPRELLDHLGIAAPRTTDAKALTSLSADAGFSYGGGAARLTGLTLRLDQSTLTGNAAVTNLATHAMKFDLTVDRIDVDRYLSPEKRSAPAAAAAPGPDPLKTLRLDGSIALGAARIDGINLTHVRIGVTARAGLIDMAPLAANLYGGQYGGHITFDDRGTVPAITMNQTLTGVDVAQLLQDFAKTRRLSGRGNVSSTLSARGRGIDQILRTLNGHFAANLADGAIEGIDLWADINRAQALLQTRSLAGAAGTSGAGRTTFDAFKASADITNGIATTKDLTVTSRNLHVTGQGTTNLVTHAIDYRVNATLLRTPTGATGPALADVPVSITGTLTDPKVRPDVAGMAKSRLRQELGKHKDELKKKLEDKLKGLFGH